MLKVAIMLLSPPKHLFFIEIEIYPTVIVFFVFLEELNTPKDISKLTDLYSIVVQRCRFWLEFSFTNLKPYFFDKLNFSITEGMDGINMI